MAGSLSDQLLQAGLVTEEQVSKAEAEKKNRNKKRYQKNKSNKSANADKAKKTTNKKKKTPQSDLAKFYQQRTNQERKEKQEAEKQKQEAARLKKERRQQIARIIKAHIVKTSESEEGEIRYNFVVGTSIKYMFVTEDQQQQLSEGKLAITFFGGKKVLIPAEIVPQIHAIDPDKIVSLTVD